MKQATLLDINARKTTLATSDFRAGAIAPNAPSMTPIEPKLENPHKA